MTIHDGLLAQSEELAKRDPKRPRQVNLRRSVSSAYYALFHLLTWKASSLYASDERTAARINRTYNHGEMKKIAQYIANDKWPAGLLTSGGSYTARGHF